MLCLLGEAGAVSVSIGSFNSSSALFQHVVFTRTGGCTYCALVHARFATVHSKREDDVDRLLDEGVGGDLGERWNAVVAASVALTETPIAFGADEIARLRSAGLDDGEIVDVIIGAAFFNLANALMLSLGEPSTAIASLFDFASVSSESRFPLCGPTPC